MFLGFRVLVLKKHPVHYHNMDSSPIGGNYMKNQAKAEILCYHNIEPFQEKRKDFNTTYFGLEKLDVVMVQPPLIRDIPDEYVDQIEKAFFKANGFISDESFADTPVEANWGLFSIGDKLQRYGYRVTLLDFNLYDYVKRVNKAESITEGDIIDSLKTKKARVFAISCMTPSINQGIKIAKLIKLIHRDTYVVMGGIHPTIYAEDILKENAGVVDFIIKGEGEISFIGLLEQLYKGNSPSEWPIIHGVCFATADNIVANPPQPLNLETEDSTLNFSFWPSDVPFTPRINLSRGCMGKCTYCSANRFFDCNYRLRSIENIVADIKNSINNGYSKILFGDLSFGCNKQIVIDVCQYIIQRNLKIEWWCQMRLVDCEINLLKLMSQAGCKQIAIGFESPDTAILNTVSAEKGNNSLGVYDVCKEINKLGIALQGYFILGLPDETKGSAKRTIEYIESLLSYNMTYVHISICVPFPGTELYDNPEKYNIEIVDHNFDNYLMNSDLNGTATPVFNGANLSRYEMLALWREALATVEKHLAKRKQGALGNIYNGIFCERFFPHVSSGNNKSLWSSRCKCLLGNEHINSLPNQNQMNIAVGY
jgi:radical SAM superfamily enzyme YgiQ (UPF0313 family)